MLEELKNFAGTAIMFIGFLLFLAVLDRGPQIAQWGERHIDSFLASH